jgi:ADP-ribose pyrophosphatase
MDYTEKTLRHVNAYHGIIVDVQVDMVQLPNQAITMREVVHHPGGVCVAAVDEAGMVTVVSQYRYPFGKHLLELPAGKLEKGEDPLPAAKRELSEETGLEADTWTELGAVYTSPGFSTETLYLYLARDLHQGKAHPDPGEFLDVDKMPLAELIDQIESGAVRDAKTVVGALRAERYLREN